MRILHTALVFAFILIIEHLGLCNGSPYQAPQNLSSFGRQPISLEDVLKRPIWFMGFNGTWISDNDFLYKFGPSLHVYHMNNQTHNDFIENPEILNKYLAYTFSPSKKHILLRYDIARVFRHSFVSKYDIYDLETKKISHVGNEGEIQLCTWSPTGETLAFVLNNDLFLRRMDTGEDRKLTFDGFADLIYNGIADWVYEEEVLGTSEAFWFSPDGKKIAMITFDDVDVESFTFHRYGEPGDLKMLYPPEERIKYPKPGTKNPTVTLKIITPGNSNEDWTLIKAPEVVGSDNILKSVTWIDNDSVLVIWLNRRQNNGTIQKCTSAGVCDELLYLSEPNGWIEMADPKCILEGNNCLITNWVGQWMQMGNINIKTGKYTDISFGNFTVKKIYGYNELSKGIFYLGTREGDAAQMHIYKNDECISCKLQDIEGLSCAEADGLFSKDLNYVAITCKGPGPTYTRIVRTWDSEILVNWEDNLIIRERINKLLLPKVMYLDVPIKGGYSASVKLLLPPEIDTTSSEHIAKYPMIVSVYAGPNSVRVMKSFSIDWETYLVTTRKVIYACIDGRGSGQKGKDMLFEINNRLGTVEVDDQLNVTRYLRDHYKFIDPKRIGIWGRSYGGYVAAFSLIKDADHVFKCGIAVSPVVSWIYYDSIYTERFLGLPNKDDNLLGYIRSDITRYAENMQGHDFLLVHGSGDDNVHYQNFMILSKALQRNNIDFDQMTYPDSDHSLFDVRSHFHLTMDKFWGRCFHFNRI